MTRADLERLEEWFEGYVRRHIEADEGAPQPYELKARHTRGVLEAAREVARALDAPRRLRLLGQAAALLHDVGRFPQYARFRTFRDPDSVDHARLSLSELNRAGVLSGLDRRERRLISKAVVLHNRRELPVRLGPESRFLCALVRDADKVDIFRVFDEHEARDEADPLIELGLDPDGPVGADILACVAGGGIPDYRGLKSVADFRLLRASWIRDIAFPPALEILRRRGDLDRLASRLPDTPELHRVMQGLRREMDRRIRRREDRVPVPGKS